MLPEAALLTFRISSSYNAIDWLYSMLHPHHRVRRKLKKVTGWEIPRNNIIILKENLYLRGRTPMQESVLNN